MGSRHVISGAQLGIITTLCESHGVIGAKGILDEILTKQYVGTTYNEIAEDVLVMKEGRLPNFVKGS